MSLLLVLVVLVIVGLLYGGNVYVPAEGRPRALTVLVLIILIIWLLTSSGVFGRGGRLFCG
jgi:hypothetical protein